MKCGCLCCRNKGRQIVGGSLFFGGLLALVLMSIVLPSVLPKLLSDGLDNQIILQPKSEAQQLDSFRWYQSSRASGAPRTFIKYTFFEILNAREWLDGVAPISLKERGPYIFDRHTQRFDIQFGVDGNNRKIISFQQWDYLIFNAAESGGLTLDDIVTVVNPLFIGLAATTLSIPLIGQDVLYGYYPNNRFTDESRITLQKSAREMLFGFLDPRQNYPGIIKNMTLEEAMDPLHRFTVYTGEGDYSLTRSFKTYSGSEYVSAPTSLLPGTTTRRLIWRRTEDNRVEGTDGTTFRRGLKPGDNITAFNADTFRAVPLCNVNEERIMYKGIELLKFVFDPRLLKNETTSSEALFFDQMGPEGFFNLTIGRSLVPVFVSPPHFYGVDSRVIGNTKGLRPQKDLHELFLAVEPTAGLTMFARKRAQVNFLIRPLNFTVGWNLTQGEPPAQFWFPNIRPMTYVPLLWFEEGGGATDKQAELFKGRVYLVQNLLSTGKWAGFGAGIFLMMVGLVCLCRTPSTKKIEEVDEETPSYAEFETTSTRPVAPERLPNRTSGDQEGLSLLPVARN